MKKKITLLMLSMVIPIAAWCEDGDVFTAKTVEDVEMTFVVISEADKTCQVGKGLGFTIEPSISTETVGHVTVPSIANGYTVTTLAVNAFCDCSSLSSISIPNSVTAIGAGAFQNTQWYEDQPDGLIYAGNVAYHYKGTMPSNTSIVINDGTTGIAEECFRDYKNLINITIPEGVTNIGDLAFSGCNNLKNINIPNSVSFIDKSAFYDTGWLNSKSAGLVYAGKVAYKYKGTAPSGTEITIQDGTVSISPSAFSGCQGLVSITFPNSVTSLGKNAFYHCENLITVNLSDNLKTIGEQAFSGCKSLSSISIPDNVTSIGVYAFNSCSNLESVIIPEGVTSIRNLTFVNCTNLSSVSIPKSVITIGSSAFGSCGLTSLTIPFGVKKIDTSAFHHCTLLSSVDIPSSVTDIGSESFYECSNLTSVYIPNSVTNIGSSAFLGCNSLNRVIIEKENPISIDENTFSNRTNAILSVPLDSKAAYEAADYWKDFKTIVETSPIIKITDVRAKAKCVANWDTNGDGELSETEAAAVTDIGTVFANQNIITFNELQYFTGLTSIADYAFRSNPGLNSITIPNNVKTIGDYAFQECERLTSITIPNSVETIGTYAFKTSGLTSLYIPESVTFIDNYAFDDCPLLSIAVDGDNAIYDSRENCNAIIHTSTNTIFKGCINSTIPSSVTSIGYGSFNSCIGLESFTIPSNVTTIEESAFNWCIDLKSITISNGVISIGKFAFFWCTGLTSIIIPSSVTTIDYNAFQSCNNLTSVTVERNTPITIGSNTFSNCANATLFVPAGSKAAYEAADYWKDFKEIIELADNITIGAAGIGTFCSTHALDFSGTDDIKAYIVSAFKPSTGEVTLTRITDVPANTGIVVKGDADTYSIPWGPGETIVSNMLVGVTENTVLNKVNGDYTNYILAKKNGNLGFYVVADGTTLSAGKAYLPLPTASLPSGARDVKFVFDDEQTTDITEVEHTNTDARTEIYDLQGRKVRKPAKGLYIVNGKKVTIK